MGNGRIWRDEAIAVASGGVERFGVKKRITAATNIWLTVWKAKE